MFRKLAIALLAIFVFTFPAFCEYPTMSFSNGGLGSSGGGSSEWTASGSTQIYTEKSVGIGTSTPDVNYALDVVGDVKLHYDSNSIIRWVNSADPTNTYYWNTIKQNGGGYLTIYSREAAVLSVNPNNVRVSGILTSYKPVRVYTQSAAAPEYSFNSDTNCGMFYTGTVDTFGFSTGGIEAARFTDNQNLLLGTQADDGINKLQVTGDSKFNGDLTASGTINLSNTPVYADNAAALAGGLVAGDVYRTSTGVLMITY